jgi:hypothetical protein
MAAMALATNIDAALRAPLDFNRMRPNVTALHAIANSRRWHGMEVIVQVVDGFDTPQTFWLPDADNLTNTGWVRKAAGGGGGGLPDGGTKGQTIVKLSGDDGDAEWGDIQIVTSEI